MPVVCYCSTCTWARLRMFGWCSFYRARALRRASFWARVPCCRWLVLRSFDRAWRFERLGLAYLPRLPSV